ncbi:MAG: hypothetical protein ACRCVS_05780 [Fusobacteriaceae bacterium]
MKKILMIGIILGTIVACGTPKVERTTEEYKREIIHKMYVEKDLKAKKIYDDTLAQLDEAMQTGNEVAKQEYLDWCDLYGRKKRGF